MMTYRLRLLLVYLLALLFSGVVPRAAQAQDDRENLRRGNRVGIERIDIASPDGAITFTLLPNADRLSWTATIGGAAALDPSPVRMIVDGVDLSSGLRFGGVERYSIDETYPWRGAKSTAVNHCNGARVALTDDLTGTAYVFEVRVFDRGVAYRHVIPGEADAQRVPDELSAFVIPAGSVVWHSGVGGHYESGYDRDAVEDIDAGTWAAPPVTFKLPGGAGYGTVTEANLSGYAGMALEADGRRGFVTGLGHRQPINYPFALRYGLEEAARLARPAPVRGTITTPWRVVLLAKGLDGLVNSTLIANLCPPPDPALFPEGINTPWLRPGRAVWRYLDGGGQSLEEMKDFSRMAGELGFEHHVVEGFWRRWDDADKRELAAYSRERGVGVWFWEHSRNLRTPEARERFFSNLAEWGVAGAKIDFFDHDAKEAVDLYEALLRASAEHGILVNFHGANKPTGRHRTWPNELVREAVRGMESSSMRNRASHQTTLPFTRYLAGPADYTAMHFGDRRRDTTHANQIASAAILDSPLLTLVAHPRTILDHPAVDMIRSIPAVWDQTVVLPPSEIGGLVLFARRSGETWFLAAMCGEEPRSFDVPLAFLGDGRYQASIVRDRPGDPEAVELEDIQAQRGDTLRIELGHGGGYIARFEPR